MGRFNADEMVKYRELLEVADRRTCDVPGLLATVRVAYFFNSMMSALNTVLDKFSADVPKGLQTRGIHQPFCGIPRCARPDK